MSPQQQPKPLPEATGNRPEAPRDGSEEADR